MSSLTSLRKLPGCRPSCSPCTTAWDRVPGRAPRRFACSCAARRFRSWRTCCPGPGRCAAGLRSNCASGHSATGTRGSTGGSRIPLRPSRTMPSSVARPATGSLCPIRRFQRAPHSLAAGSRGTCCGRPCRCSTRPAALCTRTRASATRRVQFGARSRGGGRVVADEDRRPARSSGYLTDAPADHAGLGRVHRPPASGPPGTPPGKRASPSARSGRPSSPAASTRPAMRSTSWRSPAAAARRSPARRSRSSARPSTATAAQAWPSCAGFSTSATC